MPEEVREDHVIYDYDRDSDSDGYTRMNGEPMFEYPSAGGLPYNIGEKSVSKHRDDGAQGLAQVLDAFVSKMNLEVEPWINLGQLGDVTYNGPYGDRFGRLKILHARTGTDRRMQLTCDSPDFHHKGVFFSLLTYPNGRGEDFEVTHPSQLPALFQKIRKAGATEDEVELLYEPLMRFMEKMAKIEKRPFQFCP